MTLPSITVYPRVRGEDLLLRFARLIRQMGLAFALSSGKVRQRPCPPRTLPQFRIIMHLNWQGE